MDSLTRLANRFYNLTKFSSKEKKVRDDNEDWRHSIHNPKHMLTRVDLDVDQINPEELHPDAPEFVPEEEVWLGEEFGDNNGRDILTDPELRARRLEERKRERNWINEDD